MSILSGHCCRLAPHHRVVLGLTEGNSHLVRPCLMPVGEVSMLITTWNVGHGDRGPGCGRKYLTWKRQTLKTWDTGSGWWGLHGMDRDAGTCQTTTDNALQTPPPPPAKKQSHVHICMKPINQVSLILGAVHIRLYTIQL